MTDFLANVHKRLPIKFSKGEGVYLFTENGDKYLDFTAGIAVSSLGYAHRDIVDTLKENAELPWHISNLFESKSAERLAELLCEKSFAKKVFFCNSGTEAMETVIKTIRKYFNDRGEKERKKIICFDGSFHGRSIACVSAAGNDDYIKDFTPALEGFVHLPFGDIDALEATLKADKNIAGIICESIQGEGGVNFAGFDYIKNIRALCDKYGCIFALDEVQTGYGRTGKLFAYEWSGVVPDIAGIAKAMGNGLPIGGALIGEKLKDTLTPGSHGTTYGGNPLVTSVALRILEIISDSKFLESVSKRAETLDKALTEVVSLFPNLIEENCGFGLMKALRLKESVGNFDVFEKAIKYKLLPLVCRKNGLRFLPPLIITDENIVEFKEKLIATLENFNK